MEENAERWSPNRYFEIRAASKWTTSDHSTEKQMFLSLRVFRSRAFFCRSGYNGFTFFSSSKFGPQNDLLGCGCGKRNQNEYCSLFYSIVSF
jgi:hypothetical protein